MVLFVEILGIMNLTNRKVRFSKNGTKGRVRCPTFLVFGWSQFGDGSKLAVLFCCTVADLVSKKNYKPVLDMVFPA